MEKAYIFTSGRSWYIDYFTSLADAEATAKDGWSVDLYTTTLQIPY